MEEKNIENQETENQEITLNEPQISEAEIAEIESTVGDLEDGTSEVLPELILRHPQQILTNKQVQFLLMKKEEDMTETEKGALSLFLLRAKHHNSRPKMLSSKQRIALKKKRKASRDSRKVNR